MFFLFILITKQGDVFEDSSVIKKLKTLSLELEKQNANIQLIRKKALEINDALTNLQEKLVESLYSQFSDADFLNRTNDPQFAIGQITDKLNAAILSRFLLGENDRDSHEDFMQRLKKALNLFEKEDKKVILEKLLYDNLNSALEKVLLNDLNLNPEAS
ncbi:hypothetical protein TUBRATIS_000790 [Tubulinosema ratisbonensis]|uniref:Uncharacterized protein n=1 Tax=Tubulinosema ratisbonensis TaxID=291195 RepID=A0A437AQD2_9MICR|nr:hypothetical protein TUBRATIS_000790 [Tubulinosema ratisbonensis]